MAESEPPNWPQREGDEDPWNQQQGDLHESLEALLDEIWRQEDFAALEDRIDLAMKLQDIIDRRKRPGERF